MSNPTIQHHGQEDAQRPAWQDRYGTRESPLLIEDARAVIREDFHRFVGLLTELVVLPEGCVFRGLSASEMNHSLKWFLGCEIRSASSGVGVFAGPAVSDDTNEFQVSVEVRYFHPELNYRPAKRSNPRVTRRYSEGYATHLWVDQGRPYWGMKKTLITGNGSQFCRDTPTVEALATESAARVNQALQRRRVRCDQH